MDAGLIAALGSVSVTGILLVTVELPDHTIRWTDGGFVAWGENIYEEVDDTFGVLSSLEEVNDGVEDSATTWAFDMMANPSVFPDLIAPDVQGSVVTVHFGAVERSTGLLIGEPDLLQRVELDQPTGTFMGESDPLTWGCCTEEARMLEESDEQRLTDAFHQSVWPGELGYANVTNVKRKMYWRADDPNDAIK